jgi:hypothetical protein
MKKIKQLLADYCTGIIFLVGGITCGFVAAMYFEYSNHEFIIASFLQGAGVLLALGLAFIFFEQRTHKRRNKIDAAVRRSTNDLRTTSEAAVIYATGTIHNEPSSYLSYGPTNREQTYQAARQITLERSSKQHDLFDEFPDNRHFGEFRSVLLRFQELTVRCEQLVRLFGPGLTEYDALLRCMNDLEIYMKKEESVWKEFLALKSVRDRKYASWEKTQKEFPGRFPRPPMADALPSEAVSNLLGIAELAVRLVDVLESDNFEGDSDYEAKKRFAPVVMLRSDRWGSWRPVELREITTGRQIEHQY